MKRKAHDRFTANYVLPIGPYFNGSLISRFLRLKNISSRNLNTQTLLKLVPTKRLVVLWLGNCVTPTDFRDIRPSLAHSWRKNVRSVDYSPPVLHVRM